MGRLGRSGFTDSARAELFAYQNRKKKRIKVYLELDAQSKKRLNTESPDQQFISGVEKALKEQGRHTPFRVPVAVHMHFHVGVKRMPPQIHQLPKHYLDLLQTPITSRPADRRRLLLQDDRLVEALFCSYSFADEEPATPFMTFDVMTLTSFIRDLELHQKIATGNFDDVDGVRELEIKNPYGMGDYEEEFRDNAIDEYRRLVQMGERGRKRYGEKLYDALLLMNTHAAQRELLRRRELRPIDIGGAAAGSEAELAPQRARLARVLRFYANKARRHYLSEAEHKRITSELIVLPSHPVRGEQQRLTHALIIDEAHRASRLKLLPTLAKESRKYGIMLIIASQEARDFQPALFSAVGNYLILRVTDQDAKVLASQSGNSRNRAKTVDQLKEMKKYQALFFNVETGRPQHIALTT